VWTSVGAVRDAASRAGVVASGVSCVCAGVSTSRRASVYSGVKLVGDAAVVCVVVVRCSSNSRCISAGASLTGGSTCIVRAISIRVHARIKLIQGSGVVGTGTSGCVAITGSSGGVCTSNAGMAGRVEVRIHSGICGIGYSAGVRSSSPFWDAIVVCNAIVVCGGVGGGLVAVSVAVDGLLNFVVSLTIFSLLLL